MTKEERIARREGNTARRSDLNMMSGYLKLAKDLGAAPEDIEASRGALQEYRQSTKGQGAEYDRPDSLYSFLSDPIETTYGGKLSDVAQQYDDYNLRNLLFTDLGGGASTIHGFNPRAVGNAIFDLNPNKFQRVDNMFDLIGEQWGKDGITEEDVAKYGHLKALNPKKFGENAFRLRMANDSGDTGSGDNYLKVFYRKDPATSTYSLVPKESEPFRKFIYQAPKVKQGFLGDLGPLAQIAAIAAQFIPGGQIVAPYLQAATALDSASRGNYAGALLSGAVIEGLPLPGGEMWQNPLYAMNPLNKLGPAYNKATDTLNWSRIAADAAARGAAAGIDSRDILSSAASALTPVLGSELSDLTELTYGQASGLSGPLLQYALANIRGGRGPVAQRVADNSAGAPAPRPTTPWYAKNYGQAYGTGRPTAPASPRYV